MPANKGRLDSKIEGYHARRFQDMRDQSFSFFSFFTFPFSSFHTITKLISSNSQVCTLIQLKFGTLVGCIQVNSGTNFGDNTAQFHGDTNVNSRKQRSNFRHAYRVNRCLE